MLLFSQKHIFNHAHASSALQTKHQVGPQEVVQDCRSCSSTQNCTYSPVCCSQAGELHLNWLCCAVPSQTAPTPDELGHCDSVYLTEVGDTQVVVFKHGKCLFARFFSFRPDLCFVSVRVWCSVRCVVKQRKKTEPSPPWWSEAPLTTWWMTSRGP